MTRSRNARDANPPEHFRSCLRFLTFRPNILPASVSSLPGAITAFDLQKANRKCHFYGYTFFFYYVFFSSQIPVGWILVLLAY